MKNCSLAADATPGDRVNRKPRFAGRIGTPATFGDFDGGGTPDLFCDDGDGDVVRGIDDFFAGEHNISSGMLADGKGVNPTELVDAGNLSQLSDAVPDVIAVIDNELVLTTANVPGLYATDGPYAVDLYLWNPATGELVLWTDVTAGDAANDGVWSKFTTLHYTQDVIASGTGTSTWNQGADLELQTADFNGDGIPDLWAVDPATATVVPYTAKIKGSTAKSAGGAKQSLVTPAHEWELDDLASGSANQAFDSGSDSAFTLRNDTTGATWTTDPTFGAAVKFDGTTGHLVLYVDGVRTDTVRVSGGTTVDGQFVVGANQIGGAPGSYFPGEIAPRGHLRHGPDRPPGQAAPVAAIEHICE